jgi:hypothetical protein
MAQGNGTEARIAPAATLLSVGKLNMKAIPCLNTAERIARKMDMNSTMGNDKGVAGMDTERALSGRR